MLLEVLSGGMVSFGGSPFLFLHNPNSKNESQYDLRQIENGNLVGKNDHMSTFIIV